MFDEEIVVFMMIRKEHIKQSALILTQVYLFLTSFMATGWEEHTLKHGHTSNHIAQHLSVIHAWMCLVSWKLELRMPRLLESVQGANWFF